MDKNLDEDTGQMGVHTWVDPGQIDEMHENFLAARSNDEFESMYSKELEM